MCYISCALKHLNPHLFALLVIVHIFPCFSGEQAHRLHLPL